MMTAEPRRLAPGERVLAAHAAAPYTRRLFGAFCRVDCWGLGRAGPRSWAQGWPRAAPAASLRGALLATNAARVRSGACAAATGPGCGSRSKFSR